MMDTQDVNTCGYNFLVPSHTKIISLMIAKGSVVGIWKIINDWVLRKKYYIQFGKVIIIGYNT